METRGESHVGEIDLRLYTLYAALPIARLYVAGESYPPNADLCSTLRKGEFPEILTKRAATTQETEPLGQSPNWLVAARAAEAKKATGIRILDLREVTSFTDYFIICSVANPRQGHAVSDEIAKELKEIGELPVSLEGLDSADWVLMDYGDFIVHIFSEPARAYYDLERLWRHGKSVNLSGAVVLES